MGVHASRNYAAFSNDDCSCSLWPQKGGDEMNIWELFGFKETPTGIGKVMSICMVICLVNGYFLEAFFDHIIMDVINYTCLLYTSPSPRD